MKTSTTHRFSARFTRVSLILVSAVVVLTPFGYHAQADTYTDQINQLQSEIDGYQSEAAKLADQENTLQNALGQLAAQKNAIQTQIDLTQAKLNQLNDQIAANEKKLESQQEVLTTTISNLSADNNTSPIEMLASSGSIGDLISSQQYRSSVQGQLQSVIKQVKETKATLATQQQQAEGTLADQKKQRDLLASKEAEQANLLAATQGQEAQYQNMISSKKDQVASLRTAQAAAMRSSGGGAEGVTYGASSYPWMGSSMDYDDYCQYYNGSGGSADPWGYCARQCVSYVAWKLNTDGRGNHGYSGLGNAANWGSYGSYVPVSDIQPGDVVVWYIGYYGHVMYVESVNGDTVNISQMNVPYNSGQYSTGSYSKSTLAGGAYSVRRFH